MGRGSNGLTDPSFGGVPRPWGVPSAMSRLFGAVIGYRPDSMAGSKKPGMRAVIIIIIIVVIIIII